MSTRISAGSPGKPLITRIPSLVFAICVILALLWGWSGRNDYWYSADHGIGYAFGIAGLGLMGLLLLYPLRKHWKPMSGLMPVRYWFRMHMVFGILGPVLILFHADFHQGSTNSSVALYSMLLVAASGLVGRYVYTQIHRGLYGEAIRYRDLEKAYESAGADESIVVDAEIVGIKAVLDSNASSMWRLILSMSVLRRRSGKESSRRNRDALDMLVRMARLRIFKKLFSYWHFFHMPIFFMMLITAAVHIIAVHMY